MAKRQNGYLINLRLFVPVNPKDLHDTTAKGKAIVNAMEWGDLTGIRAAKVLKASHRYTSMANGEEPGESGEVADLQPGDVVVLGEMAQDPEFEETTGTIGGAQIVGADDLDQFMPAEITTGPADKSLDPDVTYGGEPAIRTDQENRQEPARRNRRYVTA